MSLAWLIFRIGILTPWLGYLCWSDAKCRRLPNVLTLGGLAVGLCAQAGWNGWSGFTDGLGAAGIAVAFLIIPFLVRAAGAGDVKMLAACGAFLGMRWMPLFLMAVSFAGLFVALALLFTRKVTAARIRHALRSAFDWTYDRAAGRAALPPKTDEKARVPFGIAIAIGVWVTLGMELCMRLRA